MFFYNIYKYNSFENGGVFLKKKVNLIFQSSAVFIGTIVGAGLASGQEITQFFTTYGYKSFIGILICCIIYIPICSIIVSISINHNLKSYNQLITLVSPGYLGRVTDFLTGFFLISGAAIILAGSGALIHQYFDVSNWVGVFLMAGISLFTLLKDTKGLITINSFIVPSLTIVIVTIFLLYVILFGDALSLSNIKNVTIYKTQIVPAQWLISSLLYAGFNILCCSGVLVPLSKDFKKKSVLIPGLIIGSLGLTMLCFMINLMLSVNVPYIFKYEIPLLYIVNRFGPLIQIILLCIIWCEMFSTEVSDIYSVGKTLEQKLNISYRKSVILVLLIAIPVSQIGFKNLIKFLYPGFGAISLIFMVQCVIFFKKHQKNC